MKAIAHRPGRLAFRDSVLDTDPATVRVIVESSGFFYPKEVEVAESLVRQRLAEGERSGYYFIFSEFDGQTVGYACFGPTPCTLWSWDLYWIAVHASHRGQGLGRAILSRVEEAVVGALGKRLYVETSSRKLYEPTRAFYLQCGYKLEATIEDFYGPADSKCIFVKVLP